jgi:chromate transporter
LVSGERHVVVTAWTLLRVWAGIGLQSFGGGASTQLLIRRAFVERHDWIAADELARMWNLCLFTPGINLVALTVLIGRRLGGARGIAASLAGLLLPSAAVTCGLAAGFVRAQHSAAVHAVLRGVIPATAGIMLVVGFGFAQPLMRRAATEGMRAKVLSVAIITAGTLALIVLKLPVAVVVLGGALLGAVLFTPWQQVPSRPALDALLSDHDVELPVPGAALVKARTSAQDVGHSRAIDGLPGKAPSP